MKLSGARREWSHSNPVQTGKREFFARKGKKGLLSWNTDPKMRIGMLSVSVWRVRIVSHGMRAALNQVFQMARDFVNNFACGAYAVSVEKIKTRKSVPKQRDDLTFSEK